MDVKNIHAIVITLPNSTEQIAVRLEPWGVQVDTRENERFSWQPIDHAGGSFEVREHQEVAGKVNLIQKAPPPPMMPGETSDEHQTRIAATKAMKQANH